MFIRIPRGARVTILPRDGRNDQILIGVMVLLLQGYFVMIGAAMFYDSNLEGRDGIL